MKYQKFSKMSSDMDSIWPEHYTNEEQILVKFEAGRKDTLAHVCVRI